MRTASLLALTLGLGTAAYAQLQNNQNKDMKCDDHRSGRNRESFCEMREIPGMAAGSLAVDAGQNGGVTVKGWLRNEVLVRARVSAEARTVGEAQSAVGQVHVVVNSGRVSADGPPMNREDNWSVSFEIFVPQRTNVNLTAHNGGLHVSDLNGDIQFQTTNGGVHLSRLAGRVHGSTVNGGVHMEMEGNRWDGSEVDVRTTNGGVHMKMPNNYSAHVEASTVNGRVHAGAENLRNDKENRMYSANLGRGGAMIRAATTNGSVHIGN